MEGDKSVELADLGADDDSLDDFFAKKDKGKKGKKKKSKFVTTEALAKTLEKISAGTEEEESSKKEKESAGNKGEGNKGATSNDGEEWHEFEDESQRDYSDLKIQNLQTSEETAPEKPEPQYNEEGELIPPKEEEGPWKNVVKEPVETTTVTKTVEPVQPDAAPVQKSVYRPPHARLSATSTSSPGIPPGMGRRRRPQEAPVINSEIDFPSLAAAVQDTEQHVGFETVKSGAKSISRGQQQQQQNAAKSNALTLGNQFDALRD